jgi:UDP-GlcNAc:undecaprenyl-phosphate/decaprenyl-phosphate GlcNAc-1-phosphate transferase
MKEYGLTVLVAAAVTYLLTPLVRKFAIWFGAWHEPRERDVHTEPVPEMGGLAIFCGVAAALLVASRMFPLSNVFAGTRVGSGLLLAGGVVVLTGVVDDRWGLSALTKLVGQIGAGAILVWSGAVVGWLPLPGGGTLGLTPDQQTALTILIVVLTINAVNFIDGLDGLATGIVGIGAAAFYLYYYTLAKRLGLSEQTDPALASAVVAGVCLGFLPHNFHPARIFLGDTGAMLLGLLLAYVPISSLASLDPNTLTTPSAYSGSTVNRFPEILPLLLPATILLIPYVDLLLAVVRRTRAGQSPWHADKKHLHHRLLDIGHSHRTSVLIMYLWATLFAGTVVLLSIIRTKLPILGVVTLGGFLVLLWLTMPRLRPWGRRGASPVAAAGASPAPAVAVPAHAELARPANEAGAVPVGQAGPAGYDAPAGYRPSGSYDAPAPYHPGARYEAADHPTLAAPGLAGRSAGDGRSVAGFPAGAGRDAGRPGENGAGSLDPGRAGYGENGQLGGYRQNGPPESRWDAPESRWDAPAELGESEPEPDPADATEPPEARPAWPGDHPEAQEPLLPWRFG